MLFLTDYETQPAHRSLRGSEKEKIKVALQIAIAPHVKYKKRK